jgi:Uma2 family endonuclease
MALPQPTTRFDFEAYMAWEETQEERHEYVAGEVFGMSGGSDAHYTIAGNVFGSLRTALRGSACRAFIAGMKVYIAAADAALYPDVFVTCDARDRGDDARHAKSHPRLIVEVLSPSTAAWDRGRKFELYQQIPELQEYLLIEQDRLHADLFRRNAEGLWVLHPAGPEAVVKLASVEVELALTSFYEDVELPQQGAAA